MKTKITSYEDLSVLDDRTLDSIIAHEREAFGYKGYGEYAFCTNPGCRRIQSIDEVYGTSDTNKGYVPLEELEKDGCKLPDCPDCKSPSLLVFDPKYLKPHLAKLYRDAYGALLTDEGGAVRGTCIAQATNLRGYFEDMNYREGFDWEQFRSKTEEVLGIKAKPDTETIATNRVAINRPFRDGGTFLKLGAAAALHMKPDYNDLPAFACVRFDGSVLPLLEAIGYKQLVEDQHGTVAIGIEKFGEIKKAFNLPIQEFGQKYSSEITKNTIKARAKVQLEAGPKYYRGVSLLDDLQEKARKPQQKFETYDQEEITPELVTEIADRFRELFNNDFGQYLFYPSEGKPISPRQIFGVEGHVPLEQLDALDLGKHRHPDTGEQPRLWHAPKIVASRLAHLREDGQLALSRDSESSKIDAFAFGYSASIGKAFEREEWRNPTNYSGYANSKRVRNLESFLKCLNRTINEHAEVFGNHDQLSAVSKVYISNMFGVLPPARGKGKMREITQKLYGMLHERNIRADIGLLETQIDSIAHRIFLKAGAINVPEALDIPDKQVEHDVTLMAFPFDSFTKYFLG